MNVHWITTSSMSLEPIVNSLHNYLPNPYSVDRTILGLNHSGLVEQLKAFSPDLILYAGAGEGPLVVPPPMIRELRAIAPIVNIICDGGCPGTHALIREYQKAESFSFHVNIDGMRNWPFEKKDITTLCPIDLAPYNDVITYIDKDILLGFYGGVGPERKAMLDQLGGLVEVGKRDESYGSYNSYAYFLKRTKFSLNHSGSNAHKVQHCKARVLESGLARSIVLEPKGSPISNYFTPGKHYLEWDSIDDIKRHIKETDVLDWLTIVDAMEKKIKTYYSSVQFWAQVFDRLAQVEGFKL